MSSAANIIERELAGQKYKDLAMFEEQSRKVTGTDFGIYDVDPAAAIDKMVGIKNKRRRDQSRKRKKAAAAAKTASAQAKRRRKRKDDSDDDDGNGNGESGDKNDADNEEIEVDEDTVLPSFVAEAQREAADAEREFDVGGARRRKQDASPDEVLFHIDKPIDEWVSEQTDFDMDPEMVDDMVDTDFGDAATEGVGVQEFNSKRAMAGLTIENMVTVSDTHQAIDCNFVVARGMRLGMKYNQRCFAAIVWRHRNPNATTLIFPTGVFITTGANQFPDAVEATERAISAIRAMTDDRGVRIYRDIRCRTIRVKNFVAKTFLFFFIDLDKLGQLPFVRFHKQEFIGAIMELKDMDEKYAQRAVTVLVFHSGAIVFTGTKGRRDVLQVYHDVFPHLVRCAIRDPEMIKRMTTKDQKLRVEANVKRANALGGGSLSLIKIDAKEQRRKFDDVVGVANEHERLQLLEQQQGARQRPNVAALVKLVKDGDSDAAAADDALEVSESRLAKRAKLQVERVGASAGRSEQALARNTIALETMYSHAQAKREEKQQMLDMLRSGGGLEQDDSHIVDAHELTLMQQAEQSGLMHLPRVQTQSSVFKKMTKPTKTMRMSTEESYALLQDVEE